MPEQTGTPVVTPPALRPASLDRRVVALGLDALVVAGVVLLTAVAATLLPGTDPAAGVVAGLSVLLVLVAGLGVVAGRHGVTPGKQALGLSLVRVDTGHPPGARAGVVRALVVLAGAVPLFGMGLALLAWTAVTDRSGCRRGWHDRQAGTVVVDARPGPASDPEPEEQESVPPASQVVNLTALRMTAPARLASSGSRAPEPVTRPGDGPARQPEPESVAEPEPAPAAAGLWRVRLDDDTETTVEGPLLLGRRPAAGAGEPAGRPVTLRSQDMSISKTHALLEPGPAHTVVLTDCESTNGTVLVRDGVSLALRPHEPVTLRAGDRIELGDRAVTVEPGADAPRVSG